jgi:hypothetical protein
MTSMRAERATLRTRLLSWGLAYTPAAALAVLLPKCPLCIAAQLALLGVAIPLPSYARALIVAVSVLLGTVVVVARARRVRGAKARAARWLSAESSCCGRRGTHAIRSH